MVQDPWMWLNCLTQVTSKSYGSLKTKKIMSITKNIQCCVFSQSLSSGLPYEFHNWHSTVEANTWRWRWSRDSMTGVYVPFSHIVIDPIWCARPRKKGRKLYVKYVSFVIWMHQGVVSLLVKIYKVRNHIYGENFKLKLWMCVQSMALGTCTKLQLESLISMISAIHKFQENILKILWNVCETPPEDWTVWYKT